MKIRYLKHNEINKKKWDDAIALAFNSSIYAYSWYLDIACESWDALIEGDYDRVMPIPISTRCGKSIAYMPQFTDQLGVYSRNKLSSSIVDAFLDALPQKFKFINIRLNKYCNADAMQFDKQWKTKKKLDLIEEYDNIKLHTSAELVEQLDQAEQDGFKFKENVKVKEYFTFLATAYLPFKTNKGLSDYISIVQESIKKGTASLWGVYTPIGELCSAAFIFDKYYNSLVPAPNATIFLMSSNCTGIKDGLEDLLVFNFIKKNSSTNSTLEIGLLNEDSELRIGKNYISEDSAYLELSKDNTNFLTRPFYKLIFRNNIN